MKYDDKGNLMEYVVSDTLILKSPYTGNTRVANLDETLIYVGSSNVNIESKYESAKKNTPYDVTSPSDFIPDGCPSCGRKRVRYQRFGGDSVTIHSCLCGASWSSKTEW